MLVLPAASAFQLSVLILLSWMCLPPDTKELLISNSRIHLEDQSYLAVSSKRGTYNVCEGLGNSEGNLKLLSQEAEVQGWVVSMHVLVGGFSRSFGSSL